MASTKSSYYTFVAKRLVIVLILAGAAFWAYNRFYKGMKNQDLNALFALVSEGDSMDATAARAEVLRRAGELKADSFKKFMSDEHDAARALAAEALGKTKDEAAIKDIETLLKDPVSKVRLAAAEACKLHHDNKLIPILINALALETDEKVKSHIGSALHAITGQAFSANLSKWQNWYALNKKKLKLP